MYPNVYYTKILILFFFFFLHSGKYYPLEKLDMGNLLVLEALTH